MINKKVLLREGKRQVLARFADQSPDWGGGGTIPCPDLGWGTPPPAGWGNPSFGPRMGFPPPASVNRPKILPSLILRMRAVNKYTH